MKPFLEDTGPQWQGIGDGLRQARAERIERAQSLLDSFSGGEGRAISKVADVYEDDAPLTVGIVFEDGRVQTLRGALAAYVLGK